MPEETEIIQEPIETTTTLESSLSEGVSPIDADVAPDCPPEEEVIKGRPTIFTQELADTICNRIAEGKSLRRICKDPEMPSRKTVYLWLLDEGKKDFLHQYNVAGDIRADELFDELVEIADAEGKDVIRDRLRVDTRKWYLSKVMPKKFGEKLDLTSLGGKLIPPITGMIIAQENKENISSGNPVQDKE